MKIFELRGIVLQEAERLKKKGDLDSGLKGGCIERMLAQIAIDRDDEELGSFEAVIELLESVTESVGDSRTETRSLKDILAAHTNTLGFMGGSASSHRNVLNKIAGSFASEEVVAQMRNGGR